MSVHHNLRPGTVLDRPLRVALVGAGARGAAYASLVAAASSGAEIVAVAEPRDRQREQVATEHKLPTTECHRDWHELAARGRIADAVIIATQDADHVAPALAELGPPGSHMPVRRAEAVRGRDLRRRAPSLLHPGRRRWP